MKVKESETTKFGASEVPVIRKTLNAGSRVPYRKTYSLKPGERWQDAEATDKQWEHYVQLENGQQVPVDCIIAGDLIEAGAVEAVFVELWGGCVLVNHDLVCVAPSQATQEILDLVRQNNEGRLRGFPDVLGIFPDGRIALREIKNTDSKDRLRKNQHDMADLLRRLFGDRLDLAIVEWSSGHE